MEYPVAVGASLSYTYSHLCQKCGKLNFVIIPAKSDYNYYSLTQKCKHVAPNCFCHANGTVVFYYKKT